MPRSTLYKWTALGLAVAVALLAGLIVMVYHEPSFYQRAYVGPGKERKEMAVQVPTRLVQIKEHFSEDRGFSHKKDKPEWNYTFTAEQINSFFEEDFVNGGIADYFSKRGLSSPRVVIEPDRLRLAFRYGSGLFSTLVSVDFRLWLVPKEVNVVALEVLARRAGAVPISAQFFFD